MILRFWKSVLTTLFCYKLYGGGGPSSTTSNVTQSSIPQWLKPQMEAMLGSATQQIFKTDAKNNITGIRPYAPYSSNPANYVANFSPLQQQAFGGAGSMRPSGQINAASDLAFNSAQGAKGTVNPAMAYGMLGTQYGQAAANTGGIYGQMATNPYATQAYMSPYMQNVVGTQKQGALRDFGVMQQGRQAQAARAGAFGGSRQAIENAEAQRNLATQMQGIEAQGAQNAFQSAQQAQQFQSQQQLAGLQAAMQGAQTGLQGVNAAQQGYGQAGQLSSTLGALGAQDTQNQIQIAQLQNEFGGQQQAQQQNIINNAINNYAMSQQYPMQQLGMYSALLHGLNTPTSASTTYQSAPSMASQVAGLAGTALGAYGASGGFGKKKGGEIRLKSGGLADLAIHNVMKGAE